MFHELQNRRDRPRYRQLDPELDNNENDEKRLAWEEGHNFMEQYEQRGMRVREHKYPPFSSKLDQNSQVPTLNDFPTDQDVFDNLSTGVAKLNVFETAPKIQPERINPGVGENTRFSSGRANSLRPGNSGIFSQDDFPQLSSDSDSGGHSPAFSAMQHMQSSRDPRFGRGRAAALVRNAQLPSARKPTERPYGLSSYIGTSQHNRLQFPPDEELLTSSEIISASGLKAMPSGPRVRISHQ